MGLECGGITTGRGGATVTGGVCGPGSESARIDGPATESIGAVVVVVDEAVVVTAGEGGGGGAEGWKRSSISASIT